ncbi:MAG: RluA family pseudouridine synthase [Gammaproteobacteria bacterium]|nr:RluA family pseudouridine synthase [Gammaproteobacteria bacterium]MBQ0840584.1 RluA family pseudouridine synthase [Gammaproteobacteria bacterium]
MNPAPEQFELHLPVSSEGESAITLLATASGLSKQNIKQVMQNGAVWLSRNSNTRRLRRAKHKLHSGDELHLYYDRAIQSTVPPAPQLIADEGDYSLWFKPCGMYSQGTKWGDHCAIGRWVERRLDRPTFIVHRLDKAATGLILLAHKKSSAAKLASLFAEREISKHYRARVIGEFPTEPQLFDQAIDDREARSRAHLIKYDATLNFSLVEVAIDTGRKHQIRRHLSIAGYPIIGDRLYGSAEESEDAREDLQLLAYQLAFIDPESGEQRHYTVPEALSPRLITD